MSIIKKLIKKFNSNKTVEMERVSLDVVNKEIFYIPDATILAKIANRQPLTNDEINQYFNYIYNNYYVGESYVGKIEEFVGDWCKYNSDIKSLQERELDAQAIMAQSLANGEDFDVIYALWLSREIYVDGSVNCDKRIISKQDDNITVKTAMDDIQVAFDIERLNKALIARTSQKDVANNL